MVIKKYSDMTTTKINNPNAIYLIHTDYGLKHGEQFLPYDPIDRLMQAARELTAGLDTADPKSHILLEFDFYDGGDFDVEVSLRDESAKWKYLGTIGFARNYYKQDDRIYETREIVWDKPENPTSTVLKIFGTFKYPKAALRDLLTKGNYSRNRRKAIVEYK